MSGSIIKLPSQFDYEDRVPAYATPTCGGSCCCCSCCIVSTTLITARTANDVNQQWQKSPLYRESLAPDETSMREARRIGKLAFFSALILEIVIVVIRANVDSGVLNSYSPLYGPAELAMYAVPFALWLWMLRRAYVLVDVPNPATRAGAFVVLGTIAFGVEAIAWFGIFLSAIG